MSDQKGLRLTDRDLEILNFINDFGFVEMPLLAARFQLSRSRSYQITSRLQKMGLLQHQYVLHGRHGIFRLTKAGAACTDLPPLDRIPLANYNHHLTIVRIYLRLLKDFPNCKFISERKLMHRKYKKGVGQAGHVADGILVLHDNKQIAIEVELTVKSKTRFEQILKSYSTNFDIAEVWYYASKQVLPTLQALSASLSYIKIFELSDALS